MVGGFSGISMHWKLIALNNNYTSTPDNQSLVLIHTSKPVLSTRDTYKSNHIYILQKNLLKIPS